jgi:hypothetical protein
VVSTLDCLVTKLFSSRFSYSDKNSENSSLPEKRTKDTSLVKMERRIVLEPNYRLVWKRSFNYPVLGVQNAEMMGDGLENLVVLTLFGLHVMQVTLF